MYYCINIVTHRPNWANGVLLRSIAMPGESERIASGPGLLANRFQINDSHDSFAISRENGLWLTSKANALESSELVNTTRIGISKAQDLPWRWYLKSSRSVSKRAKGDRLPPISKAWFPKASDGP